MKRHFPSFLEAFLEYSEGQGPHKFLVWSAVAGIAAALERKTWIRNKKKIIYPNFFIMLVAESGIAKKSTSTKPIMSLVKEVDGISRMSTQLSGASLVKQLIRAGESKVFTHKGVNYKNSSLFAFASEASVMIGEKNGLDGVQKMLTDLYDCGEVGDWSLKPEWTKETLSSGNQDVFNPCLNLLACSTPLWLNEAIGKSGIEGGFASRCIFVNQLEMFESGGWGTDDEEVDETFKARLVGDLHQINMMSGLFRVTKSFIEAYDALNKANNILIASAGQKSSYYTRRMWHLLKLCQILSADRSSDMEITHEHLGWAVEMLGEIEPTMYSCFSFVGDNKNWKPMLLIWNVLRQKKVGDKWAKARISSFPIAFKNTTPRQLDEILIQLSSMGKIRYVPGQGGQNFYEIIDNSPLE